MIAIADQDRCQLIARGVASEYARDKVAAALYEAVLLGLEFGPRDLPLAEDREWIRGNLAVPLQEATDAALQVLVVSVQSNAGAGPDGLPRPIRAKPPPRGPRASSSRARSARLTAFAAIHGPQRPQST